MKKQLKFIDLFAGLGGFRSALDAAGAKCVFSSEWDKYAAQTYEHNYGDKPHGDITKIAEKDIPKHDIICGGFPCQAFSISGKRKGFEDTRGTLFFDIVRIAKYHKPKVLFLENVKNLAKHNNGETLKIILSTLDEIGYDAHYKVLNASQYGVPQARERVFFVCFRKDLNVTNFKFPEPTNEERYLIDILESAAKTKHLIIDRPDIKITKTTKVKKELAPIRLGIINKGCQGERIYSTNGHAITLSAYGGGAASKTGAYLVGKKVRKLSTRECLRAQGFPEEYAFPKGVSQCQIYKMCGNSVSVPVISAVFASVKTALSKRTRKGA